MKKLVAGIAAVVIVFIAYVAGSLNASRTIEMPPASWTEGNQAAEAWRELLLSLESAGARVFATTENPEERLSGLKYLAQLASASLEMKLAKGDPAAPAFTDWMSDYRKFLGDSPDAVYSTAELSADYTYEISGNVGDSVYLGFMLYGRALNGWNSAGGNISLGDMQVSEGGDFSLLLSDVRPQGYSGNWLKLEHDTHMVMVRQYFHDRQGSREARFTIRALEDAGYRPLVEEKVAHDLRAATRFFNDTLSGNVALIGMISKDPNTFEIAPEYNPEFGGVFYPTHDNVYHGGWYSLAKNQALVIEGKAPDVAYWSVSLQNRWMQSYDYRHFQVTLNNRDIVLDEDGNYSVVVSAQNPGVDNWLSSGDIGHGLISVRYQLATEGDVPSARLMNLSEVKTAAGQYSAEK